MEKERSVKRKNLGSFPFITVVFTISLSLFVLGLFGSLIIFSSELTAYIKENIEVQVYLDKQISESNKVQLIRTLEKQAFVSRKDGKPQIRFTSKDDLAASFIKETGEDFISFIGENPLPHLISVKLTGGFTDNSQVATIKKQIEKMEGVSEVVYQQSLVESVNENMAKIGLILVGFSVILLIIVYILINNTIKLALFSQRFLIRSMQLVGATAWYIQRPFLGRSVLYGIVAGILASIWLYGLIRFAYAKLPQLKLIENNEKFLILVGLLCTFGMLVSFISSLWAVRKYLKMSLDELY